MAILANYIITDADDFDVGDPDTYLPFDDLIAAFQPKAEQLEVIVRPGRDGEIMRETGVRADPTPMRTLLYVVDRGDTLDAIEAYVTLIDGLPYEIIQHGESFGFFRVLKVNPLPLVPCAACAGSLISNPGILLAVDWLVISTEEPA
jgi:hypothetical protein